MPTRVKNIVTGTEIDLKKLIPQADYIQLLNNDRITNVEFEKKINQANRQLLDMITDRSYEEIQAFLTDQINNVFEIGARFDKNCSFLHYAVYRGKKEIIELVLQVALSIRRIIETGLLYTTVWQTTKFN
jgi:hypothetical protein